MSDSKTVLTSKLEKLRTKLASAEAVVDGLRSQIATAEALLANAPAPKDDIALLWQAAPDMARTRSSKFKCREAWNKIRKDDRPTIEAAVEAMKIWKRLPEWKKDGGQFVPALDRWIKERRWEDVPDLPKPSARYVTTPTPARQQDPEDEITDPAELAKFLAWKPGQPRRMNS